MRKTPKEEDTQAQGVRLPTRLMRSAWRPGKLQPLRKSVKINWIHLGPNVMTGRRKDRGKINSASGHMELMAQEGDARCRRLSYSGTVDAPPAGLLCTP